MSSPELWGADFTVSPNLYTPQDLAPLIDHPDLQLDTVAEEDYGYILVSMAALGRAALAHDDVNAYKGWKARATAFVESIQLQDIDEPTQYYREVNNLRYAGAAHGDIDAFEQLQEALRGPEGSNALLTIVELCARQNVSPFSWIEQTTEDVDIQADAWGQYIYAKTLLLHEAGQSATAEALYTPGAEQFLDNAISGRLSPSTVLTWGWETYNLCRDSAEKHAFVRSYVTAMLLAPSEADAAKESLMMFAARVTSDPDVPHEVKLLLSQQVELNVPFSAEIPIEPRISLELSAAIESGEGTPELLDRIEEALQLVEGEYSRGEMRDRLTRNLSEFLATRGEFETSAIILTRITNVAEWRNALEHYARSGGKLDLVRRADEMRELFDDVPVSRSRIAQAPTWETRGHIVDFIEAVTSETPAIAQAESAILEMAKALGENRQDAPGGFIFDSYVARLLAVNPASVAMGAEMVGHLRTSRTGVIDSIRRSFAAYGATELAEASWDHIDPKYGATQYLLQYAFMALAAAGVVER